MSSRTKINLERANSVTNAEIVCLIPAVWLVRDQSVACSVGEQGVAETPLAPLPLTERATAGKRGDGELADRKMPNLRLPTLPLDGGRIQVTQDGPRDAPALASRSTGLGPRSNVGFSRSDVGEALSRHPDRLARAWPVRQTGRRRLRDPTVGAPGRPSSRPARRHARHRGRSFHRRLRRHRPRRTTRQPGDRIGAHRRRKRQSSCPNTGTTKRTSPYLRSFRAQQEVATGSVGTGPGPRGGRTPSTPGQRRCRCRQCSRCARRLRPGGHEQRRRADRDSRGRVEAIVWTITTGLGFPAQHPEPRQRSTPRRTPYSRTDGARPETSCSRLRYHSTSVPAGKSSTRPTSS